MVSDEDLAIELQRGSDEALEQLISRYHGSIHSYIARMSGDYHATHDIVQETFIKMCRGIKYYRPGLPFKSWLYSIASNTYKDYLKKAYVRKVTPGLEEVEKILTNAVTPEEALVRDYERDRLIRAIHSLGDIYRETLILRYYEDLKLDEIAVILNIPTGTVKSRLSKGLSQLKQILSTKEFEHEYKATDPKGAW